MNTEKIKLYAAIAVLLLCSISILWYVLSNTGGYGRARPLDTPAWKMANDVTRKLNAETKFNDIGLAVVSEKPLQIAVRGGVASENDLADLKHAVEQEVQNAELQFEVVIIKHR